MNGLCFSVFPYTLQTSQAGFPTGPAQPFNPLLDADGNVVLDADGNPILF